MLISAVINYNISSCIERRGRGQGTGGVTCGGGLTLFCLNIVVLAAWTRAEEGAAHVHTLGLPTHTAQLTLIHICAEERTHNNQS